MGISVATVSIDRADSIIPLQPVNDTGRWNNALFFPLWENNCHNLDLYTSLRSFRLISNTQTAFLPKGARIHSFDGGQSPLQLQRLHHTHGDRSGKS